MGRASPASTFVGADRDAHRALSAPEEYMTPLELMDLFRRLDLPAPVRERLHAITGMAPFAGVKPQSFQRMAIHPDVTLYRDPRIGTAQKRLIVAFCGARNRLDMPMPALLQSLPSREVDVAVLRDRMKQHYLNGIAGYADDFRQLSNKVVNDFRPQKYREVYSYGTSMGGFAAIRFSLFAPVRRAVSMVGSFPGHARRLAQKQFVPAFDLVCECLAGRSSAEIVSVYGAGFEMDANNSERLARTFPVRQIAVPDVSIHNVAHSLAISGRLPAFFGAMFDLEGGAGDDWLGLPRPSALPIVSAA